MIGSGQQLNVPKKITRKESWKILTTTNKINQSGARPQLTTVKRTNIKSDSSSIRLTSRMASMALSPTKSGPSMTQPVSTALHIKFNFTLRRDEDGEQRPPSQQEAKAIFSAFPNCHAVELSPPYLVLRFSQLPPKPWPLSAAGLPLYLTTDKYEDPEDFGLMGRAGTLSITPSPVLWKTPTSTMIKEIIQAMAGYAVYGYPRRRKGESQ